MNEKYGQMPPFGFGSMYGGVTPPSMERQKELANLLGALGNPYGSPADAPKPPTTPPQSEVSQRALDKFINGLEKQFP